MTTAYPRETVEFASIAVTVDGAAVLTGVTVCVVPAGNRPATFVDPATLAGKLGVMVSGMAPGVYTIWARVSSSPETPVIEAGSFRVA